MTCSHGVTEDYLLIMINSLSINCLYLLILVERNVLLLQVYSARFPGISNRWSPPFCNTFWRGMKEDSKFTIISNSADTQGVCWLFGWEYCDDQNERKTLKKAENLKFEIWFIDLFIKMLISYFYESWSWMWRRLWDNKVFFKSFVYISVGKNMRSDQVKYCHVP